MPTPGDRARARSALYQLLSLSFSHPIPELHAQMADGRFSEAWKQQIRILTGREVDLLRADDDAAMFESRYISLFGAGERGKPVCPMCAGDIDGLLGGKNRPEFLLEYMQFYRWFGLKPKTEGEDQELPDHLTCQLDFMAYLGHLEAQAHQNGRDAGPYKRSQRDFLGRCLGRFAPVFRERLLGAARRFQTDALVLSLAEEMTDLVEAHAHELASEIGPFRRPDDAMAFEPTPSRPARTEEMDLWE